jgi:hypothetical protein
MCCGYAKNREGDCYCMWNPLTGYINRMYEVIWMKCMYVKGLTRIGELIVDPVNVEVQDGNAGKGGKGVNIKPDALDKQDSEPDGDDYIIQDGGIAYGTTSGSEGNINDGLTTFTRSGRSV